MSQQKTDSLAQQRTVLRQKITNQRAVIALRLEPANPRPAAYPRSMTMQLLIRRSDIGLRLLAPLVGWFLGNRLLISIPFLLLLATAARSIAQERRNLTGLRLLPKE